MHAFLQETYALAGPSVQITVGDLDYWRFQYPEPDMAMQSCQLWLSEEGGLVGFAWPGEARDGTAVVDLSVHPHHADLLDIMFAWAEAWHRRTMLAQMTHLDILTQGLEHDARLTDVLVHRRYARTADYYRLLAQDWVAAGLPADVIHGAVVLSGIYEPEVVMRLSVNAEVRLPAAMARRHDCLLQPPRRNVPVLIAVGGAEPSGWIGQSHAYHDACRQAGVDSQLRLVDGANHFSLLQEAMTPGTPLAEATIALVQGIA
jgi:hypothetical protein